MTRILEGLANRAFVIAPATIFILSAFVTAAPTTIGATVASAAQDEVSDRSAQVPLPSATRFREEAGFGLIVDAWINQAGPFRFAIDTGAGATMITERVAQMGRVATQRSKVDITGLSGGQVGEALEAEPPEISLGSASNALPSRSYTIVVDWLPQGLDGILDPTEAFLPLGFVLDMPRGELRAFDPQTNPVRPEDAPPGTAVVPWLSDESSNRPFVEISTGGRALIDTGSRFGLAISEETARQMGLDLTGKLHERGISDLGGGKVLAWRVTPISVNIGPLSLTRIPTDVLSGAAPEAPILLGREALRPFELAFDPETRVIRFSPRRLEAPVRLTRRS